MSNTRWKDIYNKLKQHGIDVYSPGQKTGECTSPYVVVKDAGRVDLTTVSSSQNLYDLMCYVPMDKYSTLDLFVDDIENIMDELFPMFKADAYIKTENFMNEPRSEEYIYFDRIKTKLDPKFKNDVQSKIYIDSKYPVKGVLKAQKLGTQTLTGNQITLTDNVFTPELVKILQGGTITETSGNITGYTPPVAGSNERGAIFTLKAYSAQYNAAGTIERYECISYPNCQGVPVAFNSEDGAFRAPEYTINSAPDIGEAPYTITYVQSLPTVSS